MTIAIIAHVARAERAAELQRHCPGSAVFLDDGTLGAANNHLRAIMHAADAGESLVAIEDDAILAADFGARARDWMTRFPDRLMSFYLGTGHPPAWQEVVDERLPVADAVGRDYLELDQLIHGVCYYLPNPATVLPLLNPAEGADFMVGNAWRKVDQRPVIYPTTSLVDHADTDTVDKDPGVAQFLLPRRARRFA